MPNYPGHMLKEWRHELACPHWYRGGRSSKQDEKREYPSATDMCAAINYVLMKRGVAKRVCLKTYWRWEGSTYPEWMRIAVVLIWDDIRSVFSRSKFYCKMTTGEHETFPMLKPRRKSLQGAIERIELDPDCCIR